MSALTAIRPAPIVLAHRMERSVLDGPRAAALAPYYINARPRMATCSGVAWFPGPHLAAVNLYGGHIRIYRVEADDGAPNLTLLHETSEAVGMSEDVAVSPDGTRLAITKDMAGKAAVSLYAVDEAMAPGSPYLTLERAGPMHGIKFSPDGRHLAFTSIGTPGYVEIVCLVGDTAEIACHIENPFLPLRPKSICFSADARFAAIVTAQNATRAPSEGLGGMLSVHRFDVDAGTIDPEPLARIRGDDGPLENNEMCVFLRPRGNRYRILTANQAQDAIAAFDFDPSDNSLAYAGLFAEGTPFPHGIDISGDGRFVAVANYGDDSIRVIEVPAS